jgi:hypothetical protein
MLFATGRKVPAPQAVLGNVILTDAPLLFPAVLAVIEAQNKGGKELIAALGAGLEVTYRMGERPQAQLLGALVGVANACELDEDGFRILVGTALQYRNLNPVAGLKKALLGHDLVLTGLLSRDEWSEGMAVRSDVPEEWLREMKAQTEEPGVNTFLMTADLNPDEIVASFRERAEGKIPAAHLEYYIDAVMGLEDICCMPLFFRR